MIPDWLLPNTAECSLGNSDVTLLLNTAVYCQECFPVSGFRTGWYSLLRACSGESESHEIWIVSMSHSMVTVPTDFA